MEPKERNIKFIPDKELLLYKREKGEDSNDLLNTLPYVDALQQCINRIPEGDGFTIGLYGEWGSGKSSILTTLKERLVKDKDNPLKFVTYDAWKYSQDSFRRMFLLELQTQLGVKRSELMDRFYDNINEDVEVNRKINWKYFFSVILIVILIYALLVWLISLGTIESQTKSTCINIATLVSVFSTLAVFFKHTADDLKVTVQKSRLFAPEQFEACYQDIIDSVLNPSTAKQIWTKITGQKSYKKIIVIVDNIDRCSAQQAQELLTTIKTFMGKENVIFIIPIAVNALINHIVESSNKEADEKEANEYLRKFFNVALWIKPFHNDEMYDFTYHLVSKYNINLNPTSISIISREYATNPRRIIQLLNNLLEEASLYDADFIAKHESMICIISILREEFHNYYLKVVNNPSWLFEEPQQDYECYSKELATFWKRTKVTILSYKNDIESLDKILSNSNVFGNLPHDITTAIEANEIQTIKDFITDKPEVKSEVIDCLKDKLNKALTRNVSNDVINLLQTICTMLHDRMFDDYDITLFANLFENNYDWSHVIKYFEGEKVNKYLIEFSIALNSKNYKSLLSSLLDHWGLSVKPSVNGEKCNINIIDSIYYYCSIIDSSLIDTNTLDMFKNAYSLEPVKCFDYKYNEAELLFNNDFFHDLFRDVKDSNVFDDLGLNWQVQNISKQISFEEKPFNSYVNLLTEQMPNYKYNENNADKIKPYIEALTDLMQTYNGAQLVDNSKIKTFANRTFSSTNVQISYNNTQRRNIIVDCKSDNDTEALFVKFLKLSSILCGEITLDATSFADLMNCSSEIQIALIDVSVQLINNNVDIKPYRKSILAYGNYDDANYLILLSFLLQNDDEGNLRLESADATAQLSAILETVKNDDNDCKLETFITKVVENTNVKSIFFTVVSKYSKDELLKLPRKLQELAIDNFEDKIDEFENNTPVLSIIAQKGSATAISKLVKIITSKLLDPKTINDAVKLILSLHHCNKTSKNLIIATLENTDKEQLDKETKEKCIDYLRAL